MSNLADLLAAAGFPLTKFQLLECEDGMDFAGSIRLAESLFRHLGEDKDAQRLRDVSHALGLDHFIERLDPEINALVTVTLQRESKRRREREHEG